MGRVSTSCHDCIVSLRGTVETADPDPYWSSSVDGFASAYFGLSLLMMLINPEVKVVSTMPAADAHHNGLRIHPEAQGKYRFIKLRDGNKERKFPDQKVPSRIIE